MAKSKVTFESNLDKITEKVQEKPYRVLNVIGQYLVKEIRPKTKKRQGGGLLRKSLSYWARKKEKDLQIGFKIFYSHFVYDRNTDPMKPVVVNYIDEIQSLIGQALDEIRSES